MWGQSSLLIIRFNVSFGFCRWQQTVVHWIPNKKKLLFINYINSFNIIQVHTHMYRKSIVASCSFHCLAFTKLVESLLFAVYQLCHIAQRKSYLFAYANGVFMQRNGKSKRNREKLLIHSTHCTWFNKTICCLVCNKQNESRGFSLLLLSLLMCISFAELELFTANCTQVQMNK